MDVHKVNNEVLYALDDVVVVKRADIGELKGAAEGNARKRVRLCAHPDTEDRLHEMIIVLGKENYIRPHRHRGKSEAFHVLEGRADILIFNDLGVPVKHLALGGYSSGRIFYFRINRELFHSVLVRSKQFVFHEITNGPFDRADMEFAPWSPEEIDVGAGKLFLRNAINQLESTHDS